MDKSQKYEAIVIGSGPGGAVTAERLRESGVDVCLLEASGIEDNKKAQFTTKEMEKMYYSGGLTFSFGTPKIPFALGACVGGGSEVNSGLYHRVPSEILKEWNDVFDLRVTEKELEPFYKYCEEKLNISTMPQELMNKASLKLDEGARSLNWKSLEVPRWHDYSQGDRGVRKTMTETFIKSYIDNQGKILTHHKATKVLETGNDWKVHVDNGKGENQVLRAKYVFLCAGALQTPTILQNSGITRNIGKSLQFHPTIKVLAEFDEDINYEGMGVPVHQVKEFSPTISFGCSISSRAYQELILLDYPDMKTKLEDRSWKKRAIYYSMIKPEAKARVKKYPFFKESIINYQLSQNDLKNIRSGLKDLIKLLFAAGAKKCLPSITHFETPITKASEIGARLSQIKDKDLQLMTIHLFGSCPMGENNDLCPLDSYGQLKGYKNIQVNDASMICSAPGVNPQGAIMAFAKRNIDHFLKENGYE